MEGKEKASAKAALDAEIPVPGDDVRKKKLRKGLVWLLITAVALIVATAVAWGIASDWGSVRYYRGNAILSDGKGVATTTVMPADASDENPYPVVILQHGAGSQGYQELPYAIELSRRGYAVLMTDRFDVGESDITHMDFTDQDQQRAYMRDIVHYVNSQEWCDGRVVLSGFSQGGMRTVYSFEELQDELSAIILWVSAGNITTIGVDYPVDTNIIAISGEYDHYTPYTRHQEALAEWTGIEDFQFNTVYGDFSEGTGLVDVLVPSTHEFAYTSPEAHEAAWTYLEQAVPTGTDVDPGDLVFDDYYLAVDVCMVLFVLMIAQIAYCLSLLPVVYDRIWTARAAYRRIGAPARVLDIVLALVVPVVLFFLFSVPLYNLGSVLSPIFNSEFLNGAIFWFTVCAIFSLIVMIVRLQIKKRTSPLTVEDFGGGVAGKDKTVVWKRIGWTFLIAAITIFIAFEWMNIVTTITGLGYVNSPFFSFVRITPERFVQTLPYYVIVLFCIIMLSFSIATTRRLPSTGRARLDTALAIIYNVALAILPVVFILLQNFAYPYITGNPGALIPTDGLAARLTMTGCLPFPVMLGTATAINVFLYRKTGNIWLGTFASSMMLCFFTWAYAIMGN